MRSLTPFGGDVTVRVSGKQTVGRLCVLEIASRPGEASPRHQHSFEDEWFHVVEGVYEVDVGGDTRRLEAGESAFAPRGLAHAFRNVGDDSGRLLVISSPAGMDDLVATTGALADELGPLEPFMFLPLWEESGLTMMGA